MANLIGSLRLISSFDWSEFFESVSLVEQVLQRDPAAHLRTDGLRAAATGTGTPSKKWRSRQATRSYASPCKASNAPGRSRNGPRSLAKRTSATT